MKKVKKQKAVLVSGRRRRYSEAEKQKVLLLVANGMTRSKAAATIGASTETLRRWVKEARQKGTMPASPATEGGEGKRSRPSLQRSVKGSPYRVSDPGQGLGEHEVAAILELKQRHPSMGPAQIRAQLKRFRGWRVSIKAIARVLRGHGYLLVHRGSRPEGPEPISFEAPRRNALWQLDFAEMRVKQEKYYLLIILDDFSRFIVGHSFSDTPSSQVARETIEKAIARHGKPEAVRTDRGGAFLAYSKETDFGRYLEAELIDHIVGRSYNPKGGGKVESAVGTVRRELWDVEAFSSRREAEAKLAAFFKHYNTKRAHMGIGGLTPADRYFGRADEVLDAVDAISRKRQGAAALLMPFGGAFEEIASADSGAPLEVMRLLLREGVLELTFCGATVRLGPLVP